MFLLMLVLYRYVADAGSEHNLKFDLLSLIYLTSGRGGSAPDADLSASQLRGRYGIQNKQFEKGDGGLMLFVGIGAIIAIVGAIAYFVMNQ